MGYTLVLGLSSGSNRRSINKQAFPSRPGRWAGGQVGGGPSELATRHSPISPFAICHSCVVLASDIIHTNVWARSCAFCFSYFLALGCSPTAFFIIYVTHSTRILLVDCFAYTCSFLARFLLAPPLPFCGGEEGVAVAPLFDSPRRANIMNGNSCIVASFPRSQLQFLLFCFHCCSSTEECGRPLTCKAHWIPKWQERIQYSKSIEIKNVKSLLHTNSEILRRSKLICFFTNTLYIPYPPHQQSAPDFPCSVKVSIWAPVCVCVCVFVLACGHVWVFILEEW